VNRNAGCSLPGVEDSKQKQEFKPGGMYYEWGQGETKDVTNYLRGSSTVTNTNRGLTSLQRYGLEWHAAMSMQFFAVFFSHCRNFEINI
jgi:hypothetical protein